MADTEKRTGERRGTGELTSAENINRTHIAQAADGAAVKPPLLESIRFPEYCGRSWAEVDLDKAKQNFRTVKKYLADDCGIIAVVKADAYGHGAPALAAAFLQEGAAMLAVSCLDEGLQLREAGISAPVLMLSEAEPERHAQGIAAGLTYTVFNMEKALSLNEAALRLGRKVKVHIKIDTGMGRIGFPAGDPQSIKEIKAAAALPALEVEGIFTHFATADGFDASAGDDGKAFLDRQFALFTQTIRDLEAEGVHFKYRHCCNSPAGLTQKHMHLDLVRPGLILYGLLPDNLSGLKDEFSPVMSLHSRVEQIKELKKGQTVSYGRRYTAAEDRLTATVPIGYADGYRRIMSGKAEALIRGQRVKQLGTICMDACIFDVTKLRGEIREGDEVLLWGAQGNDEVTAEELAAWQETINYEVPCALTLRIPRIYRSNDQLWVLKK